MSNYHAQIHDKLIPASLQPVVAMDLLTARGLDLEPALRGTTLFIQDLPFADKKISPWHFEKLLFNCEKLWAGEDFGFIFGHSVAEDGIGPLDTLLKELYCVSDWSQTLATFFRILCPSLVCRRHQIGDNDYLLLFGSSTSLQSNHLPMNACAAAISHHLKYKQHNISAEFFFPQAEPENIELFQTHVAAPCNFSAPFAAVRLRSKHKQARQTLSIRAQLAAAECQVLCTEKKYLLETLSNMLWDQEGCNLSLQDCAARLDISIATLKRRLSENKCSFQKLSDAIRSEKAVLGLLTSDHSTEQLSKRLCFTDISNFRRTFKRWTGMTPKALKLTYQGMF